MAIETGERAVIRQSGEDAILGDDLPDLLGN
jgi:hypothetical protein